MRIGLTCTSIEPALTQGKIDGIGTYTKNLYQEFLNRDRKIIPISFPNNNLTSSAYPNGKLLPFSYTASTIASLANPFPFSINDNLNKHIDILHSTDHMIPKINNIPTVITIHDALMFKYPKWFYNTRFATLKKWARKKSLAWSNHIITGSHSMIAELVEFCNVNPDNISVVYHGITPQWHEQISPLERSQILAKYNLPEKFILFTGTLHPKKNLPRLIKAYLLLPKELKQEYPLIIVGRSGWDTEESLATIKILESQQCGRWLDYVNLDELRALFQSATLYAHPSLHEGFGLTLIQAFASGTAVLTSNITAMPEIAGDAAILVDPTSIDAIKHGLETLLTNPTLRAELIAKGLKRASEFSWEKCAEQTLAVYQRLV